MRGVARFGAAARYGDPLAYLNDDFQGSAVDPKWTMYKPASTPGASEGGGFLSIPILGGGPGANRSFWFDNDDGCLLYQDVTGDFDLQVFAEARDAADTGPAPVTDFQIIGLAAHDPAEVAGNYNYVHIGLGSNGTASLQIEFKSTEASVSNYTYTPHAAGDGWIRLVRQSQVFTTYWRAVDTDPWTLIGSVDRSVAVPQMPATLRCGLMTYANVDPSDILGRFSYFTAQRP